ncbi:MAG TPA: apolipoprotein N-acyltransferase [Phycisphaerales bacterium]|nr:apolipoprotein N-acyltransferase [Phycisphaerales bacterium]
MKPRRCDARTPLLGLVHALLFALAFPDVHAEAGLWPLAFFAVVPLAWLALLAPSARWAAVSVFITQLVMWLWIGRWLVQVTVPGYVPYALILSVYPTIFVLLLRWVSRHPRLGSVPLALSVPVLWVGIEFLRGEIAFDGYPWYLVGHPLVEAPILAQSADLFGAYFISFLAAMTAGATVAVLHDGVGRAWRSAALVAGVLAVNAGYGAWRLSQPDMLSDGPTMLIVQTNLPQNNKMRSSPQEQLEHFDSFIELTVNGLLAARDQGERVEVMVWPETMLPGFGFEPESVAFLVRENLFPLDHFTRNIELLVERSGVPMLVGSAAAVGLRYEEDDDHARLLDSDARYNAAYLIQNGVPKQRYDKVFLTPFGETMPYISRWPWLEQKMLSFGASGMKFNLDRGGSMHPLVVAANELRGEVSLATPICFEATMAWVCRGLVYDRGEKRASALVNLTNDAWFGWFAPGRVQHAQVSRFRAIENRVPMVRAANSGVSMAIDSMGRITDAIGSGRYGEPMRADVLTVTPRFDARIAPYAIIRDVWGWLCFSLTLLIACWAVATWRSARVLRRAQTES